MKKVSIYSLFTLILLSPCLAFASGGADSLVPNLLIGLILIILGAKIGGHITVSLGQPAVLGELGVGLILGNLALVGINNFQFLRTDHSLEILSELGVIFLLFQVGLETNLHEMRKVGLTALTVATLGVIAPFVLGFYVSSYFMPQVEMLVHVFVGATLTATSVGITARVLKDLNKIQTKEGQIILGAAVIDDVLGLLVLAVVTGLINSANTGQDFAIFTLVEIILKAVGFLGGAVLIGSYIAPKVFDLARSLNSEGILLATSLLFCFGLSYLASISGLAPIVGAFTAGLILDPIQYKNLQSQTGESHIEELIAPISSLLVPIFFVIMGAKVNIAIFGESNLINYALVLTFAAIIGKQICGLGIFSKNIDKIAVGVGMIPRGEVGLIFIGIGSSLKLNGHPIIDSATYGAVVIMVILTTLITPPLIKWRFSKS